MARLAASFAAGAAKEDQVRTICKRAAEATIKDLLNCHGIAIGSPEYFGTMAGLVKDFFDRTYEDCREKTVGLPYVVFVCAGNDGRGALTQIDRLAAGYRWRKALEHVRLTGEPSSADLQHIEELGHTFAAGIEFGIF